ncbi:MAG: cell wall hydrolase [Halanaerobiales bacterium]|nr:cell wall hydrolase [Halanaerobiales bacterium]
MFYSKMRKLFMVLVITMFIFVSYVNVVKADDFYDLGTRMLEYGDEGSDVAILQQELTDLNLYSGRIDGIYGKKTVEAVKRLQKANELKVDGIAGNSTIQKLPNNNIYETMDISREQIILLARIIHGEARGESFTGKVAVGAVILNRVKSSKFPDTIREVILQRGQFSSLFDGQANFFPDQVSMNAAKTALVGYDPTHSSLFFYNPKVATNLSWISQRPIIKKIGDHVFAR